MKDKFGTEINVGDVVVYAASTNKMGYLRTYTVTKIKYPYFIGQGEYPTWNNKKTFLKSFRLFPGNAVVVPYKRTVNK